MSKEKEWIKRVYQKYLNEYVADKKEAVALAKLGMKDSWFQWWIQVVKSEKDKSYLKGKKEVIKTIQEYLDLNTDEMLGTVDYENFGERVAELLEELSKVGK